MLETPRLILRSWRDADIDPWVEMSADRATGCERRELHGDG
jgi:RimJ/RimL family protein N-acetyltransferase